MTRSVANPFMLEQTLLRRPRGYVSQTFALASRVFRLAEAGFGLCGAGDREDRVHVQDRVREVIHNFNEDGFDSLAPKYAGKPAAEVHVAAAA